MKNSIIASFIFGISLFAIANTQAADLKRGQQLLEENCIKCHVSMVGGDGSAIYTREDRRIDSLEALDAQVHRCKTSLGVSWPEDQIADVVAYLNHKYYKFKK
jgi:mono/diheme cytochrome c family protein